MGRSDVVSFKVEGLDQIQRMIAFLSPETFQKAQRGGLRYAAKAAIPAASKAIGARYNITASRIKQDINGPFIRGDEAKLIFSRKPPTLLQFGFKPGRRGSSQPGLGRGMGWGKPSKPGKPATAMIVRGRRQQYPTAFLAPGRNGAMLPFRPGKGYTANGRRRLEIEHGPSIGSLFAGRSEFGPVIRAEVEARINEQFIKGFQRFMDSAARGRG